ELFLEFHDEFDNVERVGPDVFDEVGVARALVLVVGQVLADDFNNALLDRHARTLPGSGMTTSTAAGNPSRGGGNHFFILAAHWRITFRGAGFDRSPLPRENLLRLGRKGKIDSSRLMRSRKLLRNPISSTGSPIRSCLGRKGFDPYRHFRA